VKVRGRRKSSVENRASDVETSVLYITIVVCFFQAVTEVHLQNVDICYKKRFYDKIFALVGFYAA